MCSSTPAPALSPRWECRPLSTSSGGHLRTSLHGSTHVSNILITSCRICGFTQDVADILASQGHGMFQSNEVYTYVTELTVLSDEPTSYHATPAPDQDAGYLFDSRVRFQESTHTYTLPGSSVPIPNSTLVASLAAPNSCWWYYSKLDTTSTQEGTAGRPGVSTCSLSAQNYNGQPASTLSSWGGSSALPCWAVPDWRTLGPSLRA